MRGWSGEGIVASKKNGEVDGELRFMRLPEVLVVCGLSRSTVYAYVQRGQFPAPVRLTARTSGWGRDEVIEWARGRIRAGRAG